MSEVNLKELAQQTLQSASKLSQQGLNRIGVLETDLEALKSRLQEALKKANAEIDAIEARGSEFDALRADLIEMKDAVAAALRAVNEGLDVSKMWGGVDAQQLAADVAELKGRADGGPDATAPAMVALERRLTELEARSKESRNLPVPVDPTRFDRQADHANREIALLAERVKGIEKQSGLAGAAEVADLAQRLAHLEARLSGPSQPVTPVERGPLPGEGHLIPQGFSNSRRIDELDDRTQALTNALALTGEKVEKLEDNHDKMIAALGNVGIVNIKTEADDAGV